MIDGFYKAHFKTPLGEGAGLVSLHGGVMEGGDPSLYYTGTYAEEGGRFSANFRTARHSSPHGMASVFGKERVQVDVSGKIVGDVIEGKGQSPDAPGIQFAVTLRRLAPA